LIQSKLPVLQLHERAEIFHLQHGIVHFLMVLSWKMLRNKFKKNNSEID